MSEKRPTPSARSRPGIRVFMDPDISLSNTFPEVVIGIMAIRAMK